MTPEQERAIHEQIDDLLAENVSRAALRRRWYMVCTQPMLALSSPFTVCAPTAKGWRYTYRPDTDSTGSANR